MNELKRLKSLSKVLKETYKPGMRIEVECMEGQTPPVQSGERGTIVEVDDYGLIMVALDSGRLLSLIYGKDEFRILSPEETYIDRCNHEFIKKFNLGILPQVNVEMLKESQETGDTSYIKTLLKSMHKAFAEAYDGDYFSLKALGENFSNLAVVCIAAPAVIKGANGIIYPALVDLDLASSGEHYCSDIFTTIGLIEYDGSTNMPKKKAKLMKQIVPYQYWYTPYLEDDIHVDFENVPSDVAEILEYVRGKHK